MKWLGSISELVAIVFRKSSKSITVEPLAQTTGSNKTINIPDMTSADSQSFVLSAQAQSLTNKTIVAATNTITTAASGSLASTELNAALAELDGDKVAGPVSSVDNHLVRFDGITGKLAKDGSPAVLSDAGALSGLTQLDVDQVRIDGAAISTTAVNQDLSISPNGTGGVNISGNTTLISGKSLNFQDSDNLGGALAVVAPASITASRTYTLPNSGVDGDVVINTATQTLSNKTITSPTISGTVAGAASYTNPVLTTPDIRGMLWNNATPAALSGTSFAATADNTAFEFTSGAGPLSTITGGADGRTIMVTNMSAAAIPLTNSLATADGIVTGTGANMTLGIGASVILRFEATAQGAFGANRWYVIGGSAASASSSGEINAILNPIVAIDTTGWLAGTNHTVTRLTTGSPLDPIVATALRVAKMAAAATTESSTSGGYYPFTLPVGLESRKLKAEFYAVVPATGTWKLSVYDGTTRLALSTDSAGATILPAGFTGRFTAYFDTTTNNSYTFSLTETAGVVTNLDISNVVVGPGIQATSAIVGEWQSYTPTSSGFAITSPFIQYQRIGSNMFIRGYFTLGTRVATEMQVGLPTGHTIGGTGTATIECGSLIQALVTADTVFVCLATAGDTFLNFGVERDQAANNTLLEVSGALPSDGRTSITAGPIPIAEWAGSGTVNLGQNDQQFLSNSNTSTTTSDTTSFQYGQSGAAIVAVSSIGNWVSKRVQTTSPMSASGKPQIEVSADGTVWYDAEAVFPPFESGTAKYGIDFEPVSSTQIDVRFGGNGANGVDAWSLFTSWKWRLRVVEGGVAVGFGAATATSSGLIKLATPTIYDFANVANPGAVDVAFGSGSNQVAGPQVSTSYASSTLTMTFSETGYYQIMLDASTVQAAVYTLARVSATLGGTATRYASKDAFEWNGEPAADVNFSGAVSFIVNVTASSQTLTIAPTYRSDGNGNADFTVSAFKLQ